MAKNRKSKNSRYREHGERLIGWLISYELDELGAAFEVRSGRSFIAAQKNGASGRVIEIENPSLSTPHCAIHAGENHKVLIQDIFTEGGSYLTRADGDTEQRITGPVELHHGDWLRIGKTLRLQVCLINGTSSS